MDINKMSRQEKVAALLLMLGEDLAAEVLKHLERRDLLQITSAMQKLGRVPAATLDEIVKEFSDALTEKDSSVHGSPDKVASILSKAFKPDKAQTLASELSKSNPRIESANLLDPKDLAKTLAGEHPQTIALILAHMSPDRMAQAVRALSSALRQEVLLRISRLDQVSADLVEEVESLLQERLSQKQLIGSSQRGGAQPIAQMLNRLAPDERQKMLDDLAVRDPEMAAEVESLLFVFDDLVRLSPQDFQLTIREVGLKTWLTALKASSQELQAKFFASFSIRARKTAEEDFQILPKIKKTDALKAQDQILSKVKELIAAGKILSFEDDLV